MRHADVFISEGANNAIDIRFKDAGQAVAAVTFYADGSIKVCTWGRNSPANVVRLNACLPDPYHIRAAGQFLCIIHRNSGGRPVAKFLSSARFTPEGAAKDNAAKDQLCESLIRTEAESMIVPSPVATGPASKD